ncbi:MAG TPA: helix-turn-helix transcriptional regulator [Methylomirabilota bacterium]|nr:helix-turn-helix transcriptional regulator [Methylomirabilota bacterium]
MSYLAEALSGLMRERGVTKNVELANRTGIDQATISRWLNSLQLAITDEDLEKVARALSKEPKDHARLVAARMLDVRHGPGAELVSVKIEEQTLREEAQPYGKKKLSPGGRKTFEVLANEYPQDSDLRAVLDGLAEVIARNPKHRANESDQ